MIIFAEGLSSDPKQAPMLHGLIETMIKSPYRGGWSMQAVLYIEKNMSFNVHVE